MDLDDQNNKETKDQTKVILVLMGLTTTGTSRTLTSSAKVPHKMNGFHLTF